MPRPLGARPLLIKLINRAFFREGKSAKNAVFMRVREGFCGRFSKQRIS